MGSDPLTNEPVVSQDYSDESASPRATKRANDVTTSPNPRRDNNLAKGIRELWIAVIVLAAASAITAYRTPKTDAYEWIHWLIIVFWTLGPPTWFLLDAAFRSQPGGKGALTPMEQFFYDAAGKFWAGVLAVLLAIYAKDGWLEPPKAIPSGSPPVVSPATQAAKGQQTPPAGR